MDLYTLPPLLSSRPPTEPGIKSPLKPLRRRDNIRSSRCVHQMTPAFAFSAQFQDRARPYVDKVGNRRWWLIRFEIFARVLAGYISIRNLGVARSEWRARNAENKKEGERGHAGRLACVEFAREERKERVRERERERERKNNPHATYGGSTVIFRAVVLGLLAAAGQA